MATVADFELEEILTDLVSSRNNLILDSGCSEHMFNTARQIKDFVRYNINEKFVVVTNGAKVPVMGEGNVEYCGEYSMLQDFHIAYYQ